MKIVRTQDARAIIRIATHAKVFPWITDDQSVGPLDWKPPMNEKTIWLLASHADSPFGWAAFFPRTGTTLETHFAFLPQAWGGLAFDAFREMLRWIQLNTEFARLVGEIPRSNRLAMRFARKAGFKAYGVNEKSLWRRGQLEDQFCFGLNLIH